MNSFFQTQGISHHVSCPHAHQQNGSAARKHRHIVEVGLALLAQAYMPLKFWDEAFLTATYLINMLPSKAIKHDTHIHHLLGTRPDYSSLRVLVVRVSQIFVLTVNGSLCFTLHNVSSVDIVLIIRALNVRSIHWSCLYFTGCSF